MKLNNLEIKFNHWGENAGKYTATVSVNDVKGNRVSVVIAPEATQKFILLGIDEICRATEDAASELKKQLLESIQ